MSDEPDWIEVNFAVDEPNPFGEEGATPCWVVMDGEKIHGTAVIRKRTEDEGSDGNDFELFFIPDDGETFRPTDE